MCIDLNYMPLSVTLATFTKCFESDIDRIESLSTLWLVPKGMASGREEMYVKRSIAVSYIVDVPKM